MSDRDASLLDDLLGMVEESLHDRSGAVFHSGPSAFTKPAALYLLGLNPGGDPVKQREKTVARNIAKLRSREPWAWSSFADESWRKRPKGTHGAQPRVLHLLKRLELDAHAVPASNVVFVRTARESDLAAEKDRLLPLCWRVHAALIERLSVRVVACFGRTAGKWVREQLGAAKKVDEFVERNDRKWRSSTHATSDGLRVVTLTHPSIADWTKPATDPTHLVQRAIDAV